VTVATAIRGHRSRTRLAVLLGGLILSLAAPNASAQRRSEPRTAYGASDFAKIKWLVGSWAGAADGEKTLYQRFEQLDDSTYQITYFRDAGFGEPSGSGRLYLSVGRVYHTFGSNRWVATRVGDQGLYLVPQTAARSNFAWTYLSPDHWTFTMRTGVGGHEQVTVYDMTRVKR
jgi:hypothetical protein